MTGREEERSGRNDVGNELQSVVDPNQQAAAATLLGRLSTTTGRLASIENTA